MPAFSTLRTFVRALNTGDTNITRVLTILMHYPARLQPKKDDITVNPELSTWLKDELGAAGRMKFEEIDHIENHWPMAQKESLLAEVLLAIDAGRPMVFKWTLTSDPTPKTDVVWPPNEAPLTVPVQVTFRSPSAGVTYSPGLIDGEGNPDDVVIAQ